MSEKKVMIKKSFSKQVMGVTVTIDPGAVGTFLHEMEGGHYSRVAFDFPDVICNIPLEVPNFCFEEYGPHVFKKFGLVSISPHKKWLIEGNLSYAAVKSKLFYTVQEDKGISDFMKTAKSGQYRLVCHGDTEYCLIVEDDAGQE